MDSPELDWRRQDGHIEQPDDSCGLCGNRSAGRAHYLDMFMARKSATLPGPAGITYVADIRRVTAVYKVCASCEKKHAESVAESKRDPKRIVSCVVCYLVIVGAVVAGFVWGLGWFSLLLLIPGGAFGGLTRCFCDAVLQIKDVPQLYVGHRFVEALQATGWSVGKGPSRWDIKSLPEHWPDEQRKINDRRRLERDALKNALKPRTLVDKIAMIICILLFTGMIFGMAYIVLKY